MKELFYTFLVLCFTSTLNAQWIQIPSGTYENLNDIQFFDANTGYAVGNAGVVLKSTNGGQNWTTINTNNSANNYCVYFLTSESGYIGSSNSIIIRTTNGGSNWLPYTNGSFTDHGSIYFTSTNIGLITATNTDVGAIFKTTNSGQNWYRINLVPYLDPIQYSNSLYFINQNYGWCIIQDAFTPKFWHITKTTNGGDNWSNQSASQSFSLRLNSVHFISTTVGFSVGDSGKVYKTNNGGNNWLIQNSTITDKLNDVKATDLNKAIIVGNNGTIKATSNGGTTWYNQNSTTTNNLNSIYMINTLSGFITGDGGTILKTTNGGVYVRKIEDIIPNKYELHQNYPNPFNPSTTIRFSIPKDDFVKITMYDINGKLISRLLENKLTVGTYETVYDASNLNSGIYFVRLEANNILLTQKISLIK